MWEVHTLQFICITNLSIDSFFFTLLQKRFPNRPIVEFEIAAQEQMKITELRLAKLFSSKAKETSTGDHYPAAVAKKAEGNFISLWNNILSLKSENLLS